jgi:hypothetical protein
MEKIMKFKLTTIAFAASVAAISIYANLHPSYDLGLFINQSTAYAQARTLLAVGILAYVLVPMFRLKVIQFLILLGGGVLLILGVSSIFSPMLFGYLTHYTALGDTVIAIESGTISLLAGLQLSTKKLHLVNAYYTVESYLKRLPSLKAGKLTTPQSRSL